LDLALSCNNSHSILPRNNSLGLGVGAGVGAGVGVGSGGGFGA